MLPPTYELPAELLLVLTGVVACFAGYRLFKVVLAIYGFIIGAMLASSIVGVTNTTGRVVGAVLGGAVGAVILVVAYCVGIGLVGAGLGALVAHLGWGYVQPGDPTPWAIVGLALVGAVIAMLLQRYVIVVATAFGGAWTMIVGWLAIESTRPSGRATSMAADVWILYPMAPAEGQRWVPIAWLLLGSLGTVVQLGVTGRKR
jgi:hypothetical protein